MEQETHGASGESDQESNPAPASSKPFGHCTGSIWFPTNLLATGGSRWGSVKQLGHRIGRWKAGEAQHNTTNVVAGALLVGVQNWDRC